MPVDPALVPVLDAARETPARDPNVTVQEQRDNAHGFMQQSFMALGEPGPDVGKVSDVRVSVDGGEITVRVYTPPGAGPFPAHIYFHGGAFWLGELDHFDVPCRELCAGAGCIVVSVDYRLAPEHRFPVPPEDCYAALLWTVEHAYELGIDPSRVSIGGGSAGGNLTAVVALMARDRGGPLLVLQVLDIPVTDLTMSCASITENGEGYMLTRGAIEQYCDYYLADPADATNPYASPMLADDLSNLPPAVVMTAEFDPLRDEGERYADRLAAAGVPVQFKRWDGHVHGSSSMTALVPSARDWRNEIIRALRAAYA
ncbi:MAG: alpha/beta hydrolase [Acidimicrobiia bacterium]